MNELQPIERWFASRAWEPFDFQRETWRAYLDGENGLVHAPTGTGKTYAVWLGPLAEWLNESPHRNDARLRLRILWITPLRALANDTAENLQAALDGLNIPWNLELRTGDTSATIRKRQRTELPPALITTPESLSVMLSYPGASQLFGDLRCVIVDEWHELLGTKRGVQTELGLARLRRLSPKLRSWGLSATLGNLDEAMNVLIGTPSHHHIATPPRSPRLICGDIHKATIVDTLRPDNVERFPWSGHLGTVLLPQVIDAIESARTTLLFTNVRSQAEIWFQQILKARPDLIGAIALHHGSLDRDIRRQVEDLLRDGRIKCVVCTSSLDLGVDFSPVDQVLQLGSPKGIARMMQRAGRSGHQPGATSRIVGVPTNALELMEFAAARDAARAIDSISLTDERCGTSNSDSRSIDVESRQPIDRPLDVLVQHLGTIACGDGFVECELREEVRTTHAFAKLTDAEWHWAMDFVRQGGPALRAYPNYARIVERDGRWGIASQKLERMHRLNIGTITADTAVKVAFVSGSTLGTIEESFISRLEPGDRFVFAGKVLELIRLHNMVAHVRKAKHASGIIPRWNGGRSPLSNLLAEAVRRKIDEARLGIYESGEMQLLRPLLELQMRWSRLPAPDELLIERSESRDGHHVFIYPLEGRMVHEGLSSLVAHRLMNQSERSMHVTATDYGFELLSHEPIELAEDEWRQVLTTQNLVDDLLACLNTTALARRAFRDIARVAGLIIPGYPGQGKSTRQMQASSQMFFDVFNEFDPGNLLLDQARREVLDRELEVCRVRETLDRINSSRITIVETDHLTPFGFPIWADRIRTQHVTSETWSRRIERMVVMLEKKATGRPKRKRVKAESLTMVD